MLLVVSIRLPGCVAIWTMSEQTEIPKLQSAPKRVATGERKGNCQLLQAVEVKFRLD
jgi:hypothetical protein